MTEYNYCPKCGNSLDKTLNPPHCSQCDITYYENAKPCASVLPIRDGKVLLAKRANDPHKGEYDIIGGFMEVGETPEAAALREAKEETGLDMKIVSLLGIYNCRYGDGGDYVLDHHYIAEVTGGQMQAQDDAAELEWFDISNLPLDEGLENTRVGLRDLQKRYRTRK
jgi:ADP-ribose pyrophosphatase YjhB (NUDIX family)